jgi:hypothetical protein
MTEHPLGNRTPYPLLLAVTIVLGLASRQLPSALPVWLAKDPGDILYAVMVYWAVRLFLTNTPGLRPAIITTAVCFAVEFAKYIHAPWLDGFRLTLLGRLTLGVGFHISNLVCYLLGVAFAVAVETVLMSRRTGQVQ